MQKLIPDGPWEEAMPRRSGSSSFFFFFCLVWFPPETTARTGGKHQIKYQRTSFEGQLCEKMSIFGPIVLYHLIPWALPDVLPFYSSVLTSLRQQKVGTSNCPSPRSVWPQSGGLCVRACIHEMRPCACQLGFQWAFYRA